MLPVLNFLRWVREYAISWGLLSVIYSLTVAVLLQPILEASLKATIAFRPLWFSTCALLLIPGVLEAIRLPPLSLRQGLFKESLWKRIGSPFCPIYLRHEFRRSINWITLVIVVLGGSLLPRPQLGLWILLAQLPMQRALYSIHRWQSVALLSFPKQGGTFLLRSLLCSQILQMGVAWLSLGMSVSLPLNIWLMLGSGIFGAAISASSVALEGDSGRPWIVNFMSLAAGTIGGYLCLASPWFLILAIYVFFRMEKASSYRLKSVEHFDEDTLIS